MTVYLAEDAALIRSLLPPSANPPQGDEALFLGYAVLMRAKGLECTAADVHDAWSAWQLAHDPQHKALVPFAELSPAVQNEDLPYVDAIHAAARVRAASSYSS